MSSRRVIPVRAPRLRKSLTVNAVALMTATVATNILGLVFWTVAAQLKRPAVVGRSAAAVAALVLLSSIAQLNLTNVFGRLLPRAGHLGTMLVRRGYLAVIALSMVVGTIYVSTGLSSGVVIGGWSTSILFVGAVAVLALFSLQDSVLTALRLAPWVTAENISFSVAKLMLLPLFVGVAVGSPIVAAWVIPAAVAVVVVTGILFRTVLPHAARVKGALPGRRRLFSFIAGEYAENICATAVGQVMPLLVLAKLGPTQAAYFTLPWLAALALRILLWNVGFSFAVETLGGHAGAEQLLQRTLLLLAGVVAGALVFCVLLAHPLLELAGGRYAAHGSDLLRLVGLSAPFSAIVRLYETLVWLDQRVWVLAGIEAVAGAAMIVMALILIPSLGLVAVGWAYLASQAAAAVVMAPLALRRMRRGQIVEA